MPKTIIWQAVSEIRAISLVKNAANIWELSAGYQVTADTGETKTGTKTLALPLAMGNNIDSAVEALLSKIKKDELNE